MNKNPITTNENNKNLYLLISKYWINLNLFKSNADTANGKDIIKCPIEWEIQSLNWEKK